jgi:hypothetical protein
MSVVGNGLRKWRKSFMGLSKYINAIKLAKNYIKRPYVLLDKQSFTNEDHAHICFPYRIMGDGFKDVCPYYNTKEFDKPEWSDCCDYCKYFGVVDFDMDDNNKKCVSFVMSNKIVETFEKG